MPRTAGCARVTMPSENAKGGVERDIPRILEDVAARLRGEVSALQVVAARARQAAAEEGPGHEERLAQLREANEKLVVATIHAQAMTETVQQANRDREQFLAMLAHELRNPLAPMASALAILRRVSGADPQLSWIHDVLKRQVDQMTMLLNELLEVSRVTSGKVVLRMRPIAVSEFMRNAVEAARPLIEARKQSIEVDPPAASMIVCGDPTRLAQIFGNLLNNASKYSPEGGAITFAAREEGETVEISVSDNGAGIDPEMLPRLFELFTQERRSLDRSQGGLGIGLSVVRSLVELHGGHIEATSAGRGQGSEFVVALPRLRDVPAAPERSSAEEIEIPGNSHRIVLIEDNVDANDSLAAVLVMMGHEVFPAFDGVAGMALIRDKKPDIVVCDIGLPALDGYEVISRLRGDGGPMPLMIALTGYGQAEDRAHAQQAGFDHHFSKPVDVEALLRLVAREGARRIEPTSSPGTSPNGRNQS